MLEVSLADQRKSFMDRFLGVIVEPSSTFRYVVSKPDLLVPLLIILLSGLATIPINTMAREQIMQHLPATVDPTTLPAYSPIAGFIQTVVGLLIVLVLKSALFTGIGALFGSKVNYKTSMAVVGYLNFPSLIATVISCITVKLGSSVSPLSFGFFLSQEQLFSKFGIFLNSITPFTIWYLVLSAVALHHLWSISKKKALFITIAMWLLVVGITILLTSLSPSVLG